MQPARRSLVVNGLAFGESPTIEIVWQAIARFVSTSRAA